MFQKSASLIGVPRLRPRAAHFATACILFLRVHREVGVDELVNLIFGNVPQVANVLPTHGAITSDIPGFG
jgi:hypothetical protein